MTLRTEPRRVGWILAALQEPLFRRVWLARTASSFGDALIPVALAFAVLGLRNSASDLGIVLAAFTVTRVAFVLVGGVWADRLSRRGVMVSADIARACSQGALAFLLLADHAELWHFVAASAVSGAATAFFLPASSGVVPDTVSAPRLQQANALLGLSDNSAGIVGPAVAGVIVATLGAGWAFAIDAATFVVSAIFLLRVTVPTAGVAGRQNFFSDLMAGWREVTSRTWMWTSFIAFAVGNAAFAALFVLGPLVAKTELGGVRDWGILMTAWAVGGVAGGVLALRYRPSHPLIPAFLLVLPTALLFALLAPPFPLPLLAIAFAVGMAGNAIAIALWDTTVQEQVPRWALSRVSAYDTMISFVFMPMGFTLAGPLASWLGADVALIVMGTVVTAVIAGNLSVPAVRAVHSGPRVHDGAPVAAGASG